jgi:hypothetical protein
VIATHLYADDPKAVCCQGLLHRRCRPSPEELAAIAGRTPSSLAAGNRSKVQLVGAEGYPDAVGHDSDQTRPWRATRPAAAASPPISQCEVAITKL